MIQRLRGRVENITVVKHIAESLDLCSIRIDFDEVFIFGDANDYMDFLNQEVYYTIRPDVIDGNPCNVVCDIAAISNVQVVETVENVKLIPGRVQRTICNFSAKDLRMGEYYPSCVALLGGIELGSSSKAKWFDCSVIDQDSKAMQLRLFAGKESEQLETLLTSYVGSYVRFDLEMTKYGPQTKEILCLNYNVEYSPEVEVAKAVLEKEATLDPGIQDYVKYTNLIESLLTKMDGEPGYMLVRMASEIYMINAVDAISADLDIRAMKRAVFCSRGYCTSHTKNWSKPMLNTNRALKVAALRDDMELLYIIDVMCEEPASPTKQMYIKIRNMVNDIIDIRRGVINEKDSINSVVPDFVRSLGGLL